MKTILLADDEEHLRTLVRTTLDQPGYRIIESEDGAAALALAERERPDVVVLDWMMPSMTGIEVMTALRRNAATADIPVILLTAKGQRADSSHAFASGASAYLAKPFSPLELLAKVDELCRDCAAVAASAAPVTTANAGPVMAASAAPAAVERPTTASVPSSPDGASSLDDKQEGQLALYARDLARMVDAERERSRELAEANARLQLLDQIKSDFLTFISHELRTPLALMGAFDLYEAETDPAERARVTEIIRTGYERLNGFVARGLEYFDWLAGECSPLDEATDLGALVKKLIADTPAFATGGRAVLEVADRGRGFPPALAEELFRPFTVLDTLHHAKGSGLSLALAAAIIQAHGGAARATSPGLDRGATFVLDVPLLQP